MIAAALAVAAPVAAQDLTLTGVMTGADNQTYREVPFKVPAGVTSLTVQFEYSGKEQRSVIDLGLRDPQRFRGWSGGNKSSFTITDSWATPSYLPGPLPAGTWRLVLGVPNLRKDARAPYTAKITFGRGTAFHGFAAAPLKSEPGWYRGDLHLHTAHSDGACASRTGKRVPCPVFRTLEAAAARGLDFVAITDHNTNSQNASLAEMQPFFDDLLLIPGREVTTFRGHANVLGVTAPIDFQLNSPRTPGMGRILGQVEAAGGLLTINHPGLPSGEACMGCGWTAPIDWGRVPAIEVINGDVTEGPLSGLSFWEARLNAGYRITAVGGSDNHDAGLPPVKGVGVPTTVVQADNLSQDAILAGLRAGHAFIDTQGTHDRMLEVAAAVEGRSAAMGDVLRITPGATVALSVRVHGATGGRLVFKSNIKGFQIAPSDIREVDRLFSVTFEAGEPPGWFRADVVGPDGKLWLLGNPIYLRP